MTLILQKVTLRSLHVLLLFIIILECQKNCKIVDLRLNQEFLLGDQFYKGSTIKNVLKIIKYCKNGKLKGAL